MTDPWQLDLFDHRPELSGPQGGASPRRLAPEGLSDEALIAAIPDAVLDEARALAAEAGKRRLGAAVAALQTLCRRFVGYGANVEAPEQVAALKALGLIGGPEASRAVVEMTVKGIFQGPALVAATTAAAQLGVIFPTDIALALLRHANPLVRATACVCVRPGRDIVTSLIALLADPDAEASTAAACALGRMGRVEALAVLKRCLIERPSPRVIEAVAGVADDEAIVFLARAARARPELVDCIVAALDDIDNARAASVAARLRKDPSNQG